MGLSLVDPKGIRNLGPTDPKIKFHESIKEIEQRLGDPAALAVLHRLEYAVHHDEYALEYGKVRDANAAHPVSGRRPGNLYQGDAEGCLSVVLPINAGA
jgi:hypothetical protein